MAHRDIAPVSIQVDVKGFDVIADRLSTSLSSIDAVARALKTAMRIGQRRAVSNVSGNLRTFNGKTFIVNRQTGKLARSIQGSMPNPLAIVLDASAEYASDVEQGTRGPVDLKKTKLAGKIIPFPLNAKKAKQGQDFLAASGSTVYKAKDSHNNPITTVNGVRTFTKYASTGASMGKYGVVFRRVPTRGGVGWIIPQRPARPFMEEAGAYTAPILADLVEKAFADFLTDGDS